MAIKGTGLLTNKTSGGSGSRDAIRTDEWRARNSASNKIAQNRPEVRARKSASQTGKKRTPEQIANVVQSQLWFHDEMKNTRVGGGNPSAKRWMIGGVIYACGKDAAFALGIEPHNLKRRYPIEAAILSNVFNFKIIGFLFRQIFMYDLLADNSSLNLNFFYLLPFKVILFYDGAVSNLLCMC